MKTIVGRGTERHRLYYVDEIAQQGTVLLSHGSTESQACLWHRRLGHPSTSYLKNLFPDFAKIHDLKCNTCYLAKSHRHYYKLNNTIVNTVFSLVDSDVGGPAPVTGGQGFKYFLLFIDDCSRMTSVYFLKSKSEVFENSPCSILLLKHNMVGKFKSLGQTMGGNMLIPKCILFALKKA